MVYLKRKSPIHHTVHQHIRKGRLVNTYPRGHGSKSRPFRCLIKPLKGVLPSETSDGIRVKGGYVYINPETGEVTAHTPLQIRRPLLKTGLAGYSKDGTIIFIDFEVPPQDVAPLLAHEAIESVMVLDYGYSYPRAHAIATQYEKRYIIAHKGNWSEYCNRNIALARRIYARKGVVEPSDVYSGSRYRRLARIITRGEYI